MLEQARKANIGLTLAHQTVSQIRKRSIDPATVIGNTATKIVGTQYPDDAREMGKAMRVSTDTILDLPQYSFGMYHRSTGFVSIRAPKHPLAQFEYRHDAKAVQDAMEARYGGIKPEDAIEPAAGDTAGSTAPAFDLDDVKPI